MIELALTLASATDVALVNSIHQGVTPFKVSAQEAPGKGDLAFGRLESLKTKFLSGRTDGSAERRRAIVIGLFTSPAGCTSPDCIFKFFKSGDIPFHDNLLIGEPKCQMSKFKILVHLRFDIWSLNLI
jgi:hypothetical protein